MSAADLPEPEGHRCRHCGLPISDDGIGYWTDAMNEDACGPDDAPRFHQPVPYPSTHIGPVSTGADPDHTHDAELGED